AEFRPPMSDVSPGGPIRARCAPFPNECARSLARCFMCNTAQREPRCRHSLRFGPIDVMTATGGTMREIARLIRRSAGITAAAGNGQASGGAPAVVVPHRRPFREVQLWVEEL